MPKYWVRVDLINAIVADYINVVKEEEYKDLLKKAERKIKKLGLSDYVIDGHHYFRATDFQNAKEIKKKLEQLLFDLWEKKEPMEGGVGAWVEINSHPD
jgi:Uri superfamily endonuclease